MNDMSQVIIPKSDQLNAEDFLAGPRTFTIESVHIAPGTEQPVNIRLVGEARAWRPCKSMSRVLVSAWGPDANVYKGRSVTLYNDPKVKWGGMEVGGIRVSHMSHIDREMLLQLTATKGKRAPHIVKPLADAPRQQQTDSTALIETAREKAAAGTETFMVWWNSDEGKAARAAVRPIMDEIKDICAKADAGGQQSGDDDDPFGDPNTTTGEQFNDTPEEQARAEDVIEQVEQSLADQLRAEIAAAKNIDEIADVQQRFADSKPQLKGTDITDIRGLLATRRNELAE